MTPEERVQDSEHGVSVYFEGAWHPVGNTGGVIRLAITDAEAAENQRVCGLTIERVEECGCTDVIGDGGVCGPCEVLGELLEEFQQPFADASEGAESEVPG